MSSTGAVMHLSVGELVLAVVAFIVLEVIFEAFAGLIFPLLFMALAMPFIVIIAIFGRGGYITRVKSLTTGFWKYLKEDTILSSLGSSRRKERHRSGTV
jgi:hypothetical protein